MKVNEEKVKKLFLNYLENRNYLKDIVEEISNMVYNYPVLIGATILQEYGYELKDLCSEFYIYFIERFENLLRKYDPNRASFNTWLSLVLKSQYINWYNLKLRKKGIKTLPLELDRLKFYFKETEEDEFLNKVRKAINALNLKEKLLIYLLFFPVNYEVVKLLAEFKKITEEEAENLLDRYIEKTADYRIKQWKLEIEINKLYYKLKEKRNKTLNTRLNDLIRKRNNMIGNFDLQTAGEILGIPRNTIYSLWRRLKNKIKERLE